MSFIPSPHLTTTEASKCLSVPNETAASFPGCQHIGTAPNYVADARALVMMVLEQAGVLSNTDTANETTIRTLVNAMARDLEDW